jgi:hypothetical protein
MSIVISSKNFDLADITMLLELMIQPTSDCCIWKIELSPWYVIPQQAADLYIRVCTRKIINKISPFDLPDKFRICNAMGFLTRDVSEADESLSLSLSLSPLPLESLPLSEPALAL